MHKLNCCSAHAIRALILAGVVVTGCTHPTIEATTPPPPTAIPTGTPLPVPPTNTPPPTTEATTQAQAVATTPIPVIIDEGVSAHHLAMREGFQGDVDAHAAGTRYWVSLTMRDDPVHVDGTERVRFHNPVDAAPCDSVYFRLYPNVYAPEQGDLPLLTVESAAIDGQPAGMHLQQGNTALQVELGRTLAPGEAVDIDLAFALELAPDFQYGDGRLADFKGVIALFGLFPTLSVYEPGGMWWTGQPAGVGDPVYGGTALFDVQLTAPDGLAMASSGHTVEAAPNGDGTTTYTITTGPVREFALMLSDHLELLSATEAGITVNVWSWPGGHGRDQQVMDFAQTALAIFDEQFGPYPFAELDVVQAPFIVVGVEYPGLIYLNNALWNEDSYTLEWLTAHEVAHQWWYSVVGSNQVDEPWLDEALAEYSVEVYFRTTKGEAGAEAVREYQQKQTDIYRLTGKPQLPVGLATGAYADQEAYNVFVYRAGALFYGHLYDTYGPDLMRDFLRAYYETYRYRIAHTADVERLMLEHFGEEAGLLFGQWIYGQGDG